MSDGPDCIRCGSTLEQPSQGAQYECPDCGAVVAPEMVRTKNGGRWDGN